MDSRVVFGLLLIGAALYGLYLVVTGRARNVLSALRGDGGSVDPNAGSKPIADVKGGSFGDYGATPPPSPYTAHATLPASGGVGPVDVSATYLPFSSKPAPARIDQESAGYLVSIGAGENVPSGQIDVLTG